MDKQAIINELTRTFIRLNKLMENSNQETLIECTKDYLIYGMKNYQ